MSKNLNLKYLSSLIILAVFSIVFYACEQKEDLSPKDQKIEQTVFQQHLADHTQKIQANDLGEGKYTVTGAQGTTIQIDDALVDAAGNRVRGTIDIILIEIYSVPDMILHRKQTLADYDGQPGILDSGGEVFVKVYQNGEELFADGNGIMNLYLPTANTGGAKENMELFYGEEVGEQVIWKPTGEKIRVVNDENRSGEEYLVMIQNILGWINVDILYSLEGEEVECLELVIECNELCNYDPTSTVAAIYVNGLNSAFELTYDHSSQSYKLCSIEGEGALPLGGIQVTFVLIIDCGNGMVQVAIVTTTINAGYHTETIDCDELGFMSVDQLENELHNLVN